MPLPLMTKFWMPISNQHDWQYSRFEIGQIEIESDVGYTIYLPVGCLADFRLDQF